MALDEAMFFQNGNALTVLPSTRPLMTASSRSVPNPDLLAAICWTGLAWTSVALPTELAGVRLAVVLPLVLFWPGYVVVAASFPTPPASTGGERQRYDPTPIERVAFAAAASVGIGVLLGSALATTPVGLSTQSALAGLTAVVGSGATVAWVRRTDHGTTCIPSRPPRPGTWRSRVRDVGDGFGTVDSVGSTVAVMVLLAGVVGGGGAVFLGVGHEPAGFTEFGIQPRSTTGNPTAGEYQRALETGGGLRLQLTNHHSKRLRYEVVVLVQRVQSNATGATVVESRRLDRFTAVVAADGTWQTTSDPQLPWPNGKRLLVSRLYRVTDDGRERVATLHIWINRTAGTTPTTSEARP